MRSLSMIVVFLAMALVLMLVNLWRLFTHIRSMDIQLQREMKQGNDHSEH